MERCAVAIAVELGAASKWRLRRLVELFSSSMSISARANMCRKDVRNRRERVGQIKKAKRIEKLIKAMI